MRNNDVNAWFPGLSQSGIQRGQLFKKPGDTEYIFYCKRAILFLPLTVKYVLCSRGDAATKEETFIGAAARQMNSFNLLKLETQLNSRTQLVRYRFFAVLWAVLYATTLYLHRLTPTPSACPPGLAGSRR
jgi:hypothetical protein